MSDIASNNEANFGIINVGIGDVNPTVSIDFHRERATKPSMFERFNQAIDPIGYAQKQGEAKLASLDYELTMVKRVMEEYPFMSPERARLFAHGFNRTETQAANFEAVIEKVEDLMNEPPKRLPEPSVEDAFTDAMCDAYDDEIQDLLARALKGEFDATNSISRNALSIIKRMDSTDVETFARFCSLCTVLYDIDSDAELCCTPCIVEEIKDGGTGYREIAYEDVMQLSALGLVRMGARSSFGCNAVSFGIDGKRYNAIRTSDVSKPLVISAVALTRSGDELARYFEKGAHPMLLEIIRDEVGKQGFEFGC